MSKDTAYFSQTAARTLMVLEALSEQSHGLSLADLSQKLNCPKPSLYPILKTMEGAGYVRQPSVRAPFTLAPRVLQLSSGFLSSTNLEKSFDEVSREAVSAMQETMQMAVLDETDVIYAAKRECHRSVRLVSDVGTRLPAHATGLGKCLLASLPNDQIERRYAGVTLTRLTPNGVASVPQLIEELERVRQNGYAEDWQEVAEGLVCVSAPVRNAVGEVVAAVSCSLPIHRATPEHWVFLRQQILSAALRMSERLGYVEQARRRPLQ